MINAAGSENFCEISMMSPRSLLSQVLADAAEALTRQGLPSPRLDAEVLLCHQLNLSRPGLYVNFHQVLSAEQMEVFQNLLKRRMEAEPVAYIIGFKEFWSLPFEVSPAVLIPRPDTEILVQEVLKVSEGFVQKRLDILEIGTGSGAVSVALAKELTNAHIVATDISFKALATAKKNSAANAVRERISFRQGNLFEPLSEKFDIIASNPPYISETAFLHLPSGVREFEPREALLAGPEGTEFQEDLIRDGKKHLKGGGWLLLEIGDGQREKIDSILREDGSYEEIRFAFDYAGLLRVAIARKKG